MCFLQMRTQAPPYARNALSQALYVLRAALGEAAILGRGDSEVRLNPDLDWCDVAAGHHQSDQGK